MEIRKGTINELPSLGGSVSLFASKEWAEIYAAHIQPYVVAGKGGHTQASFLLFHKSKLGMSYTITAPLAPHIGLHVLGQSEKKVGQQSLAKDVHKAIANAIKKRNDSLTEFTLSTDEVDSQPYTWSGLEVKPRHTYHLALDKSADELLAGMTPERRKNIRKATEDGLKVVRTEDVSRCMATLQKTIDRLGIALDKDILMRLLQADSIKGNRAMYICEKDGVDMAASLVVWDEERSYYLIGGYDSEQSHQGAGTLNLWTAILDAKERGNEVFDFEGSMIPQVERYFRGFGGSLKTFFSISSSTSMGKLAKRLKS